MVKRIACFITCGYTEAGTMQAFLRKINGKYEYKQYLPNRTVKRKGDPKSISPALSGLTGDALLEKIYEILEKNAREISTCEAIVIEDDLDGRFRNWSQAKVQEYEEEIRCKIYATLEREIPVIFIYASPEIESWFIADWENGFGYLYGQSAVVTDLENKEKLYWTHHLRQYIEGQLVKEYRDAIEDYGYFDGKYYKLSDQLKQAIQADAKEYISNLKNINREYAKRIRESRDLYYSKKLHGGIMLNKIKPDSVVQTCNKFLQGDFMLCKTCKR